jgi:hypothetical protein
MLATSSSFCITPVGAVRRQRTFSGVGSTTTSSGYPRRDADQRSRHGCSGAENSTQTPRLPICVSPQQQADQVFSQIVQDGGKRDQPSRTAAARHEAVRRPQLPQVGMVEGRRDDAPITRRDRSTRYNIRDDQDAIEAMNRVQEHLRKEAATARLCR